MDPFTQLAVMFGVACAVSYGMLRLRQPLLLGYLLTGVLIGPALLNVLLVREGVELFAEFGIVALLYVVGLSLNPRVIREVGRTSFVVGLSQILITMAGGFFLGKLLGFASVASFYLAAALAFSSTIVVTKLLADRRQSGRLHGKLSIGILLVQDVAACFLLIGLSAIVGGSGASEAVAAAIGTLFAAGAILFLLAKFVLPRVEAVFGASQEFLFLFAIAWGVGLSALFHALGLSMEIGALAAGITLASSSFATELGAKMRLVRDFFLVAFFVLLGSQLSFAHATTLVVPVLVLAVVVLLLKPLLVQGVLRMLGYHPRTGFLAAIPLAQVSEFSLVLALFGLRVGHIDVQMATILAIVAFVTIAISTFLIHGSESLYERVKSLLFVRGTKTEVQEELLSYDIALFGCHRLGFDFLPVIRSLKMSYVVVDFSPDVMTGLAEKEVPSIYGDMGDPEFLDDLDLARMKLAISTVPDLEANLLFLKKLRAVNTTAIAVCIGHSVEAGTALYDAGATYVVLPHYLGGNYAAMMIRQFGLDRDRFETERDRLRAHLDERAAIEG